MKLRVVQSGIYNDQFNRASHREVDEEFETLPAYGASLVKSGYAVPVVDVVVVPDAKPESVVELTLPVDEPATFVDRLVEAGLSHRAAFALSSAGYHSRGDFSLAPDDDLLTVTWVGEGTLEKIREFVKRG